MLILSLTPWRRRGGGGGVGLIGLLLLISLSFSPHHHHHEGGQRGHASVSGQLYTSLDDAAAVYNGGKEGKVDNMLFPVRKMSAVDTPGSDGPPWPLRSCQAPFQMGALDPNPNQADTFAFYRGGHQIHYFCANRILFKNIDAWGDLGPSQLLGDRLLMPHAKFWLKLEPQQGQRGWQKHKRQGVKERMDTWMEAKNTYGLIFRIDVTGIKSRGRILKGWYHLKITIGVDHNAKERRGEGEKYKTIDKIMVTARGRTLVPGKPRHMNETNVDDRNLRPPRRAWAGGIGTFVQDFPKCKGRPDWKSRMAIQQFQPCGTVQYGEAVHGNNFYFTRNYDPEKFGYAEERDGVNSEIHLNFRLDNSFCNKYYDLDFVATGIVRQNGQQWKQWKWYQPVHRSISTRIIFASSHSHHHPDFYENADPVPRNVDEVECDEKLHGEWKLVPGKATDTQTPENHWMSITKGANLVLSGATPDSTFGGAIKVVIENPDSLFDSTFEDGTGKPHDPDATFHARRVDTYSEREARPADDNENGWANVWRWWDDRNALPNGIKPDPGTEVPHMIAGIQRIYNEFDWETWVERNVVLLNKTGKYPLQECHFHTPGNWASDIKPQYEEWDKTAEYWPHMYYDVTCGGVNTYGKDTLGDNLVWDHAPQNSDWSEQERERMREKFKRELQTFHAALPPITSRCELSLWYTSGMGSTVNPPPFCNEFYHESRLWTKYKADKKNVKDPPNKATADPALERIVETTDRQKHKTQGSRRTFDEHYISVTRKDEHDLGCDLAMKLRDFFDSCLVIPPRPYTPKVPLHKPPTREEQDMLDWEAKTKYEFRRSPAYRRGMLVSESPYSLYVWDSRLIHGYFMTIMTMFVTPISLFMARYYKETFMDSRVLLHHIWYFIHLFFSFVTQLLIMVGLWRQAKSHRLLGYSYGNSSLFHRILGWMAIGIAVLFFFLGGLRTMHRKCRAVTLAIHWAGGWIFYFLCLACMIISVGIPGSPAAYVDYTVQELRNKEIYKEAVLMVVGIWIFFDFTIHLVMTFLQCRNDKKMKLTERRFYFLSPMPVIAENFRFDTPGRFPRIYILWVYVIMSFIATTVIVVFMYKVSPRGRGFGFMTCTHSDKASGYEVYEKWTCD